MFERPPTRLHVRAEEPLSASLSLIWDPVLVAALARALRERLLGARLRAFHMDSKGLRLLLFFREATLAVHLAPDDTGVTLHDATDPIPSSRASAGMLVSVESPPDDRILQLDVRPARARRGSRRFVLELISHHHNAIVLQGDEGQIRHVLRPRGGDRPLRAGLVYAPPPPSSREGLDGSLTLARWRELLLPLEPRDRRRALLARVAWTSSINARALLGKAGKDGGEATAAALDAGHELWRTLAEAGGGAPTSPVVLRMESGALQPYPLALPGERSEPEPDLLAAFAEAAAAHGRVQLATVPGSWVEALEAQQQRTRSRLESLERELAGAPDPEAVRARGDLLLARYRDVPKRAARVTLQDFSGAAVELQLDPALSTHDNAARFYEQATRAARARARLPSMIESVRREAMELEQLTLRARAGTADLEEVRRALPPEASPRGVEAGPTLPYRRYTSSGGIEIRVGKGAKQNDELTFQHASPEDVWLHARHAAGAHVVLRWQSADAPPAKDLMEAAVLAALHSRGRTSASVPVDWTRRKHVRKPRKAPPGAVLVERTRTLFVEPDPSVEKRLLGDGME